MQLGQVGGESTSLEVPAVSKAVCFADRDAELRSNTWCARAEAVLVVMSNRASMEVVGGGGGVVAAAVVRIRDELRWRWWW